MSDVNKILKIVADFGNLPLCSGVTAVQSPPKSHTFILGFHTFPTKGFLVCTSTPLEFPIYLHMFLKELLL